MTIEYILYWIPKSLTFSDVLDKVDSGMMVNSSCDKII